jgi:hypothetical protein
MQGRISRSSEFSRTPAVHWKIPQGSVQNERSSATYTPPLGRVDRIFNSFDAVAQ